MRQIMGRLKYYAAMVLFVLTSSVMTAGPAFLSTRAYADATVTWNGIQGVSSVNESGCNEADTSQPGSLLWVFTASGADSATITIDGQTYAMTQQVNGNGNGNGTFKYVQTGFNGDFAPLNVSATYVGTLNGNSTPQLTISHGCPASIPTPVTPPAVTSIDECGTANDTFTVSPTDHVSYNVAGHTVTGTTSTGGALSVTVNAVADNGYVLSDPAAWPQTVSFTDVPCNTQSVTLCHATDSRKNPYEVITVDAAGAYNGHLGHTGPVFSPLLPKHTKWGDIIPTFTYNGQQYSLNLPAGQTILDNDCQVPAQPTRVRPARVTFTDLCGTANDVYIIPTTTGVDYQVNGITVGAGSHPGSGTVTVVAVAQQGYVLKGKTSWTHTFTDTSCITKVRPVRVTFINPTCENPTLGAFIIPTKTGVVYEDAAGNVLSAGRHDVTVTGPLAITITAYPANNTIVLKGTTSWTHNYDVANGCGGGGVINPNITVMAGACVSTALPTGTATITVNNPNNLSVDYLVDLGGQEKALTVDAGQTGQVTFTGLAAGNYSVTVRGDDDTMTATGSVTITTCPVTPPSGGGQGGGHVLGASTGLGAGSATVNELANTGTSTVLPTILAISMALTATGIMLGDYMRRKSAASDPTL